jgi:hypothetical protein
MTQVFYALPEINAKDKKKRIEKDIHGHSKRGTPRPLYDHFQMLKDRIQGMSWHEIAKKHGLKDKRAAHSICMNSNAYLKLSPKEIEILLANKF